MPDFGNSPVLVVCNGFNKHGCSTRTVTLIEHFIKVFRCQFPCALLNGRFNLVFGQIDGFGRFNG